MFAQFATSRGPTNARLSLENCCACASDPKIKLRRIWLLRTHSSPKRPHEQQRSGSTGRNGVVKTAKAQSLPQNAPILTEVFGRRRITTARWWPLNPHALNLAKTHFVAAPVVEFRRFDVRVTGHPLGDVNVAAAFQIVGDTDGAE